MTVRELIERLHRMPQHAIVYAFGAEEIVYSDETTSCENVERHVAEVVDLESKVHLVVGGRS